MALNSRYYRQQCKGRADCSTGPPAVEFNFSITEEAITVSSSTMSIGECVQEMLLMVYNPSSVDSSWFSSQVTEEEGTGVFADFSSVQYVTISGMVCSRDPSTGVITYHREVINLFSCLYPLQYWINNTQMSM